MPPCQEEFSNRPVPHFSRTHYSIIPLFQHSNCERSELTCIYDGYCWDCDPFLGWVEESIGDISVANVKYNKHCGVFSPDFLSQAPGVKIIDGQKDWDDQIFPSSLDLTEFYGNGAKEFEQNGNNDDAWKSLGFALHMLQDMTVPHHVLCTLVFGHLEYEKAMLQLWKKIYAKRSPRERIMKIDQISEDVSQLLEKEFNIQSPATFRELGKKTVELTHKRLPENYNIPAMSKMEARKMTVQAIACTINAINLIQ